MIKMISVFFLVAMFIACSEENKVTNVDFNSTENNTSTSY